MSGDARPGALVTLGAVTRPHGIRGEVRVHLFNPGSDVLLSRDSVWLEREGEPPAQRAIRSARRHGEVILCVFDGVESRDDAERLRGMTVGVPREELPPTEEDEYYHVDLIGLRALDADGLDVGEVVEVIAYPASDCLRIRGGGLEREVPLLDPYVTAVDLEAGVVRVDHLSDLDTQRSKP